MLRLIAIELILFCALFTMMVKTAVWNSALNGLYFYPEPVQERAFDIGLTDRDAVARKRRRFMLPFFLVFIIGNGFKAFEGVLEIIVVAAVSYIVPMLIFANYVGPELPNIVGAICSMISIVVCAKIRKGEVPEEYLAKTSGSSDRSSEQLSLQEALIAWAPFLLIFVLLVLTSLVPFIKQPLSSIRSSFRS